MHFVFRWLSNHHRLVPWRSITEEPNLTRQKTWNIAPHGAAHKNHLNWQSNLSLLNTWATKTIHFNEITPLPLSEITISKFMSIWEDQSQWCVIEIMTFPVKKGRKSCKLWLEMTQELSLHMKIFAEGESPGKGGWFIQQGSS